ncbi:hypothetical protein [Streptomyces sp. MMG1121]|uniref:hypothetical protein n=1 Tax=Streptomyces sp. MMG1121 TaxID=1415544 RepID=UPI0006AE0680|nr:hypothetical protein [Streptomyces sp. MMG1121]KOV64997.1 hypothetical protein ADK64_15905 [Streptomyces sp. MMG1121]
MRKLRQVALVVAAAGGLTAVGAGPSSAVTPAAYNGASPPPLSQPDAQAASATSAQATAQSYGNPAPQAAPQRGTDVAPQLNPQLNPQINPQISPAAPQPGLGAPVGQANLFRPSQECSPQTLLGANVPVALLAASETRGIDCTQANSQSNALANAHSR